MLAGEDDGGKLSLLQAASKGRHHRGVGIAPQPLPQRCQSSSPSPGFLQTPDLGLGAGTHPQRSQSGKKAFSAWRAGFLLPDSGRAGCSQHSLSSAMGSAAAIAAVGAGRGDGEKQGEGPSLQFLFSLTSILFFFNFSSL